MLSSVTLCEWNLAQVRYGLELESAWEATSEIWGYSKTQEHQDKAQLNAKVTKADSVAGSCLPTSPTCPPVELFPCGPGASGEIILPRDRTTVHTMRNERVMTLFTGSGIPLGLNSLANLPEGKHRTSGPLMLRHLLSCKRANTALGKGCAMPHSLEGQAHLVINSHLRISHMLVFRRQWHAMVKSSAWWMLLGRGQWLLLRASVSVGH